jgi:nucleotide-binding universal stress UspA family protein
MRIIYATDGSEGSRAGAELLAALPLEAEHRITVLTVTERDDEAAAEAALEDARAALRHSTATIETAVRRGHAADELLRAIEETGADLVVVGSRGRSAIARFFLGSVAERVVRHAPCPALLARPLRHGLRTVLVGIDGSPSADYAADWLRRLPLPPETEIRLFTALALYEVAAGSYASTLPLIAGDITRLHEKARDEAIRKLETLASTFGAAGRRTVTEVRDGDPAPTLLRAASDQGADLIVVGDHGHSAIERFMIGSVSENVVRHAHCSVLVVKGGPGEGAAAHRPL